MTYNSGNTLQKRFVNGKYTLTTLLAGSLIMWLAGMLFLGNRDAVLFSQPVVSYTWLPYLISFIVYIVVAFIVNSFVIIEGRISWLGGLVMWLAALSFSIHDNAPLCLSSLMQVLLFAVTLSCYQRNDVQKWIFAAFAFISFLSLFNHCYLYLLPLLFVYIAMTATFCIRNIAAAIIGAVTPQWILLGAISLLPNYSYLMEDYIRGFNELFPFDMTMPSFPILMQAVLELFVLITSLSVFVRSTSPAKPLMRKMFIFFVVTGFYLLLLSFFVSEYSEMLYVWRLPGLAIMMAYLFSVRLTKTFNVIFIILNVLWVILSAVNVWYGFFG